MTLWHPHDVVCVWSTSMSADILPVYSSSRYGRVYIPRTLIKKQSFFPTILPFSWILFPWIHVENEQEFAVYTLYLHSTVWKSTWSWLWAWGSWLGDLSLINGMFNQSSRNLFFSYYLSSEVCMWVCVWVCSFDCSHIVQSNPFYLLHDIQPATV